MAEEQAPLDVFESATQMLDVWASIAWSKMGLRPDMVSGTIITDLAQAKVAINVASFLAETVEDRLDPEDRRRVQGLVRDLKLNYVQKSREGS